MFRILRRVRIDAMDRCRHPRRASRRSTCVPHGGFRDCATRARTSLSGRSRQDASESAGLDRVASNRLSCPEKSSAKPFASRRIRARFDATIRKNRSGNRVFGRYLRTRKRKTPGWVSEGVRVPRRSGRPISGKGSVVVCAVVPPHACAAAFLRQRACVRIAMESRGVERVGGVEGGFHRRTRLEFMMFRQRWNKALLRWARTLHSYFFDCKHFFHESTGGSTNGSVVAESCGRERCPYK